MLSADKVCILAFMIVCWYSAAVLDLGHKLFISPIIAKADWVDHLTFL